MPLVDLVRMEQAMLLVFFNFVLTCLIFNDPVISETLLDWAARVPADCPRVGTFVAAAVIQMFIYAMVSIMRILKLSCDDQ